MDYMCIFCNLPKNEKVIFEDEYCFSVFDIKPASKGHCLVIPKRHVRTYFELSEEEIKAMFNMSKKLKEMLDKLYSPKGYNVGFNVEHAGGQRIFHAHMHVIPRYGENSETRYKGVRSMKPGDELN